MPETNQTPVIGNINTKWLGLFSIPFWLKILLNILIPLVIFGVVFALVKANIAGEGQGAMAFCVSLLASLLSSIILLLVKKEIEAENTTIIHQNVNSVGGNIDTISNNINQFEFLKKREHFIDKSIDTADKVISGLVLHLAEDCYKRCSRNSDKCNSCPRFSKGECNGLLRNYLYETCITLENAIKEYRNGTFKLATNIREFHTIAIDHLKGYKGSNYSVFHYIGDEELNEENYDSLDAHFLNTLLKKINQGIPSYHKENNFVIKWLLIGDEKIIKYNYDYIFYVVKTLNMSDSIMDSLFEFYTISDDDYKNQTSSELIQLSSFVKGEVQEKPSLGIFGDYFMFIDSTKPDEHGTIYTRMHNKIDGKNSVSETLLFFNSAITYATKKKFTELKALYDALPDDYKNRSLKERCKLNS